MTFVNAPMLAAVAGALLPLVVHLLQRSRYRNVRWGAMMFLSEAGPRRDRRAKIRESILLAVRMGLVALLALALARPAIPPADAGADSPASVVILLDRSASMNVQESGPERMDSARRAALSALASLRPGDEAALILIPAQNPQPIRFTTDLPDLAATLGEVRAATVGGAEIKSGLQSAATLLAGAGNARRHIILIADRQAASWEGVTREFAKDFDAPFSSALAATMSISWIPVGGTEAGNVAIESVEFTSRPIIQNADAELEIRVRNFDTIPSVALPLTVSAGGRELVRTTLNLAPGATESIRTNVKFPTTGSQIVTTRIGASGLAGDDSAETAVDVIDAIGVLVVSGDERGTPGGEFRNESDFFRLALMPMSLADQPASDPANVRVVTADAWPLLDRARERVVVLANVPRLSEAQARQLEQFVYGGGGVLVAPGNLCRVDDYNANLWRDGGGLLPAALEYPVPSDGSQATTLAGMVLEHPIFRFAQRPDDPLPDVVIGRYFPVRAAEPRGKILANYSSGRPFIVEGQFGRGRVLLMTTSLDADWNTLPLSSFYLPLMQSCVRYLAGGMLGDRNLSSGDAIVTTIPFRDNLRVTMDGPPPGMNNVPVQMLPVEHGFEARFTNTARAGRYNLRIRYGTETETIPFIVRAPSSESDLTSLGRDRMNELQSILKLRVIEAEGPAVTEMLAGARRRRELWMPLMLGVILLSLVEIVLARRWMSPREDS
jgi:hypothetical protein